VVIRICLLNDQALDISKIDEKYSPVPIATAVGTGACSGQLCLRNPKSIISKNSHCQIRDEIV
jgi:hypothetical protein